MKPITFNDQNYFIEPVDYRFDDFIIAVPEKQGRPSLVIPIRDLLDEARSESDRDLDINQYLNDNKRGFVLEQLACGNYELQID